MKEKEEGRVEGIRETGSVGRLANGDKRLALQTPKRGRHPGGQPFDQPHSLMSAFWAGNIKWWYKSNLF